MMPVAISTETFVTRKFRIAVLIALPLLMLAAVSLLPPISQPMEFHNFADKRIFSGIPNFADVISNLSFLLVAAGGLRLILTDEQTILKNSALRMLWAIYFLSIFLTAIGSAYYHLAPDSARLVWDRLPITLTAMSLLAIVIAERISLTTGICLLIPLLCLGIVSVLLWQKDDDLRLYGFVQFSPVVLAPLIFALFPSPRKEGRYLAGMIAWYALAKVCEAGDKLIFDSVQFVSGHTFKHLLAAVALFQMIRMLKNRKKEALS
jgi:hypothetical protein